MRLRTWFGRLRNDRGSMAVEFVVAAPALVFLLLLVAAGGQWLSATGDVGSAARDAVRAASVARTFAAAEANAKAAATADLGARCAGGVQVPPPQLFSGGAAVGPGAFATAQQIRVTVSCTASLSVFHVIGFPVSQTFADSATAPLDPFEDRGVTRVRRLLARLGQNDRDRGSVSLWVVMFAFVTLALLILVVDGGQVIVAKSRAADIAEQAARAAADDIDPGALRNGDVVIAAGACATPGPASELVSTYQKGVGVTATMLKCTPGIGPGGAPDVTVQVQVSMKPFLPVNPFGTIAVTATETAFLACGTANARVAC